MTGSRKTFALLTALGMVLICGAPDAQRAGAAECYSQTTEEVAPSDLAFAILKTLMMQKISTLEDSTLVALRQIFAFSNSTPWEVAPSSEMAVDR
jgi:hypothetical protein